jgi:hypothetical protein
MNIMQGMYNTKILRSCLFPLFNALPNFQSTRAPSAGTTYLCLRTQFLNVSGSAVRSRCRKLHSFGTIKCATPVVQARPYGYTVEMSCVAS